MTLFDKAGGLARIVSGAAVLAIVAALVVVLLPDDDQKTLTASFPRTVSLYEGSDVRILGVPVGEVQTVTPSGTDVLVEMTYDAKYKVPADAQAVIVFADDRICRMLAQTLPHVRPSGRR